MVKIKDTQFCVKNLKMKRKKDKKILTVRSRDLNSRFSVISCPRFEFSWKMRETRSNQGKEVKISQLYVHGLKINKDKLVFVYFKAIDTYKNLPN